MSAGLQEVKYICHTSGTLAISYLDLFAESVDDTVVRGDKARRLQSGGSTSRQDRRFGVSTNDSDLLDLGFVDRKDPVVILEKDDGFGGDLLQKRGIFFALISTLLSIAVQDLSPTISLNRNPGAIS